MYKGGKIEIIGEKTAEVLTETVSDLHTVRLCVTSQ